MTIYFLYSKFISRSRSKATACDSKTYHWAEWFLWTYFTGYSTFSCKEQRRGNVQSLHPRDPRDVIANILIFRMVGIEFPEHHEKCFLLMLQVTFRHRTSSSVDALGHYPTKMIRRSGCHANWEHFWKQSFVLLILDLLRLASSAQKADHSLVAWFSLEKLLQIFDALLRTKQELITQCACSTDLMPIDQKQMNLPFPPPEQIRNNLLTTPGKQTRKKAFGYAPEMMQQDPWQIPFNPEDTEWQASRHLYYMGGTFADILETTLDDTHQEFDGNWYNTPFLFKSENILHFTLLCSYQSTRLQTVLGRRIFCLARKSRFCPCYSQI